jgi:hypothetical protein
MKPRRPNVYILEPHAGYYRLRRVGARGWTITPPRTLTP